MKYFVIWGNFIFKAITTVCNPKFQFVQVQPEQTWFSLYVLADIDMVTTQCKLNSPARKWLYCITNLKISA